MEKDLALVLKALNHICKNNDLKSAFDLIYVAIHALQSAKHAAWSDSFSERTAELASRKA